jgi:hypothetical protein
MATFAHRLHHSRFSAAEYRDPDLPETSSEALGEDELFGVGVVRPDHRDGNASSPAFAEKPSEGGEQFDRSQIVRKPLGMHPLERPRVELLPLNEQGLHVIGKLKGGRHRNRGSSPVKGEAGFEKGRLLLSRLGYFPETQPNKTYPGKGRCVSAAALRP